VEVLTKNGFIDYSLFMIIVLRPFKNVEYFNPLTLGVGAFDEVKFTEESTSFTPNSHQVGSKRLFIGEID